MKYTFTATFLYLVTMLGSSGQSAQYVKGVIVGSDTVYRPIIPSQKEVDILESQPNDFTKEGRNFIRKEYIPCGCSDDHRTENGPCNPLDKSAMVKVYRADFSYLVAGVSNAALINQLVVQVDKPSLSFTYIYLNKKKRSVISPGFNLRIGTVDDLPTLFANGNWNATLNLGARFNIDLFKAFSPKYERYYYLPEERDRLLCRVRIAESKLSRRQTMLLDRRNVLTEWINTPTSIPDHVLKNIPRGEYRVQIIVEKDSIDLLLRAENLSKHRRAVLDSIQSTMKWSGKEHLWLSFNPDFSPRVVNLFDANDIKNQQIPEHRFLTTTLPVNLNYYRAFGVKQRPSLYTASIAFEHTNDILSEDYRQEFKKEVVNYTSTLGGTTYTNSEKKTFYVGSNRMIWNTKLGAQAVWFFSKERHFGLIAGIVHTIPDNLAMMNSSYTNLTIGTIVPAITADGKSKLNVVITGVLTDVSANVERWKMLRDDTYEPNSVWERLALTVKVGLPINFLSGK